MLIIQKMLELEVGIRNGTYLYLKKTMYMKL